jgi:hypothetical protein
MREQSQYEITKKLAHIKLFMEKMDECVVISDKLRKFIQDNFVECEKRLTDLSKTFELKNISTTLMFKEYEKVSEELNKLNIFSDTFKQNIYTDFYILIQNCEAKGNE